MAALLASPRRAIPETIAAGVVNDGGFEELTHMRRMRTTLVAVGALTCWLSFGGAASATADGGEGHWKPSQVVVFGDSNTDGGAADPGSFYNLTGGFLTGPPNVGGRFSNGPVVVEYVADQLGVPLSNFSVGGATTGRTNIVQAFFPNLTQLTNTGALGQVESYAHSVGRHKADRKALYVYWAGSNDLVGATANDLTSRIGTALDNIEQALTTLDRLGARHILVATRTPRPEFASVDNLYGVALNASLTVRVDRVDRRLKADIEVFDAFDLVADMMFFPDRYGFTEPTALCVAVVSCSSDTAVAARYVQWDAAHKTTHVHELLAEQMIADIDR
jgi:phospholipase/lecithinase/hemolysin